MSAVDIHHMQTREGIAHQGAEGIFLPPARQANHQIFFLLLYQCSV
ncbi:hypothetical protein SXCC_00369 [Gluconacetobacter sp. SXCC-1]|nr:hypothetical protein SXCC_00369 [Gluconacetobacter sp. SXCC-1]